MLCSALSNWGAPSRVCLFEFKSIKIKYSKKKKSVPQLHEAHVIR